MKNSDIGFFPTRKQNPLIQTHIKILIEFILDMIINLSIDFYVFGLNLRSSRNSVGRVLANPFGGATPSESSYKIILVLD